MSSEDVLTKKSERWLNPFQSAILLANPRVAVIEAGRRGGKTEEIMAERVLRAAYRMPGSSGTLSGKSYSKLLDQMIPALIFGLNKRSLVEGEDFVAGKPPPPHFKRPLICPKKWDHYLCFSWGSGAHLVSFDHGVTSNGLTTDWAVIDEAKQIDPVRVKSELLKTMSGHKSVRLRNGLSWGDFPEHRQLTLLSDKFVGKNDYRWINDYKKHALTRQQFYSLIYKADKVQQTRDGKLQRELWKEQRDATVYLEYSSRASLPVIGIEYFRDEFKSSSPIEFRTSILNEDVKEIEGGFYKFLDEATHTYEARDNTRIDTIGISEYLKGKGKDCRLDLDWKSDLPLKVAVDYGSKHTWLQVQQLYHNTHWTINNFWTDQEPLDVGVDKVCDYYRFQTNKTIELYDDPLGHKTNPNQQRDIDTVTKRFNTRGWQVIHMTPRNIYLPHRLKYRMWEAGLNEHQERDPRITKARWNTHNAYESYYSCAKARVRMSRKDEFEKDKSDEAKNIDQWMATHLSDCNDMIWCFDNLRFFKDNSEFAF